MLASLVDNRFTDKNTSHSYLPLYQTILTPISLSATRVLEVGIQEGGSIKLWCDFFTNAEIYGIDISLSKIEVDLSSPRIHCIQANAYDPNFIKSLGYGTFDVVIDDGPHTKESMVVFAREYPKLLKPKGILIIEDIPTPEWVGDILRSLPYSMQKNSVVHDNRTVKGRWDDIMIVAYN